jgi:hypothetical protein
VITSMEISSLRGIQSGLLDGLRPLTVLTGRNGCGKSTVLDALLIGAAPDVGEAIGRAVSRHPVTFAGARWLFPMKGASDRASTSVTRDGVEVRRTFVRSEDSLPPGDLQRFTALRGPLSWVEVIGQPASPDHAVGAVLAFDNAYVALKARPLEPWKPAFIRLIDAGIPMPLSRSYSNAVRAGRKAELKKLAMAVLPDLEDLELLEDGPGVSSLYVLTATGAVPSALSGDGVHAFLQVATELAVAPDGAVLLEEPEAFQHPLALAATADAIVLSVKRGLQVVLTTHSLELIDALLRSAARWDLPVDDVAVFRLALREGQLRSTRRAGAELVSVRDELALELR